MRALGALRNVPSCSLGRARDRPEMYTREQGRDTERELIGVIRDLLIAR